MIARTYDAILLDLDGTLVADDGRVRPRNLEALKALHRSGVRVMLATGRSEGGTREILDVLGFDTLAVVYNGAGVFCPVQDLMVEERLLSDRTVARALAFAEAGGHLPVVMRPGAKYSAPPRNEAERLAIRLLEDLEVVDAIELPRERLMRITLFSERYADSEMFSEEVEAAIDQPVYMTNFPLKALADHRDSEILVVDVQPPCRGKGEALRVLDERYGIPAQRVVAVGDAGNDVPMMDAAGLAVAMENSVASARNAADRVIGHNNSDTIADLVQELWPRV